MNLVEKPGATVEWAARKDGSHMLWALEISGVDCSEMGYLCAERARQSALRALPASPERGALESCAPITDRQSAAWAADAARAAEAERVAAAEAWVAAAEAGASERAWAVVRASAAGAVWVAAADAAWAARAAVRASASEAAWAAEMAAIADLVRSRWPEPPDLGGAE